MMLKLYSLSYLFLILKLNFPGSLSQTFSRNLSSSAMKTEIIMNYRLENVCMSHMNFNYRIENSWECSLINNLPFEKKISKFADPTNKNYQIDCICTLSYSCFDYEEFVLDFELVNAKDYMSKEYFLGKNVYTQQCEDGLGQLTHDNDWNCVLQYDRFHNDEYYCNCKRPTICRIEKMLTI